MSINTKSRSKYTDIGIIVVIVIVSAVLARTYLHQAPTPDKKPPVAQEIDPTLKTDLQDALAQFCYSQDFTRKQDFTLDVAPNPGQVGGAEVRLRLALPPAAREARKRWPFAFVRFVAMRHPTTVLTNLRVTDSTSGADLDESPVQPQPRSLESPIYFESARSEVLRRSGQAQLDAIVGPGAALLLVDATAIAAIPSSHGRRPLNSRKRARYEPENQNRVQGRRRHDDMADRAAPSMEAAAPQMQPYQVSQLDIYLVLNGAKFTRQDELAAKLEAIVKQGTGFDESRGDRIKTIFLPAATK